MLSSTIYLRASGDLSESDEDTSQIIEALLPFNTPRAGQHPWLGWLRRGSPHGAGRCCSGDLKLSSDTAGSYPSSTHSVKPRGLSTTSPCLFLTSLSKFGEDAHGLNQESMTEVFEGRD